MRLRRSWLVVVFLFLSAAGGRWWFDWWRDHSQDGVILAAARRYQVDPTLVKAVVWRESAFDSDARGKAGEIGLMQLGEIAAQEWADAERREPFEHEHVLDPATNTLAGTYYLAKLLRRYPQTDNPIPYALADYNAGRSQVLRWLKGPGTTNSAAFIDQIDFPGTRAYVRAILDRHQLYRGALGP